jgi:diguanylate cyclase (GGDEF)-like protein
MLIGSSVAFIVTGVYIADLTNGFDIVPISAFIMAVFFFFGMYKFKLFRINPVVIERLVHSFEDAVIIFDHENEILIHNEIASKIFPSLSTEVKTKVLDRVLIGETTIGELINENKNIKTEFILEIDYHKRYYDAALSMIYSYGSLIGKILILNDISDKKKIIEQLNEFAYKDGLTGIYNRRFLQTKIEIEIARSKRYQLPLSLIFIDIDNFKSINDEYGHHAGDHVLQGLVNICQTMLRDQDVFARYGGEEFIIMLPETTLEYAYEIAEEIRSLIENTKIVSENHNISFTSSFGVIQGVSDEDSTVEQFINRVDKALYKSKSRGKNTISKG